MKNYGGQYKNGKNYKKKYLLKKQFFVKLFVGENQENCNHNIRSHQMKNERKADPTLNELSCIIRMLIYIVSCGNCRLKSL